MVEVRRGFVFLTEQRGTRKAVRITSISEIEERPQRGKARKEVMVNGLLYQDTDFDELVDAILGPPKKA